MSFAGSCRRRSTVLLIPEPGNGEPRLANGMAWPRPWKRRSEGSPHPVKSTASGTSRRNGETVYCISFSDCPPQMGDLRRSANQAAWLGLAHAARCSDRPRCCGISAMPTEACSAHHRAPSTLPVAVAGCVLGMADAVWSCCLGVDPSVQPSKDAARSFSGSYAY